MEPESFAKLTPTERAKHVALTRLKKHFAALEDAGIMPVEVASKHIGAIKVLESMLDGSFVARY